jgi:hypothetical protein
VPNITWEPANLAAEGPNISIQVTLTRAAEAALTKAGQAVPAPIQVDAQVDTGASGSCVQQGILAPLGLQPVGVSLVNTPTSQNVPCPMYAVRILFPAHQGFLDDVTILEAPLAGQNINFLIGRNILARALLIYNGPHGSFTLSF